MPDENYQINPHSFHGLQVRVTGRFMDSCWVIRSRDEREYADALEAVGDGPPSERPNYLGGTCHYARIALHLDSAVITVLEEQTRIAGGTKYIDILGDLDVAGEEISTEVSDTTRDWVRAIQGGQQTYIDLVLPECPSNYPGNCDRLRELAIGKHSKASYLIENDVLAAINASSATIRTFKRYGSLYGCVCLKTDCSEDWPLFERDARAVTSPFTCMVGRQQKNGSFKITR
jgi:hypothetical protein